MTPASVNRRHLRMWLRAQSLISIFSSPIALEMVELAHMDFGKVAISSLAQIDLKLPPGDPRSAGVLRGKRDLKRFGIGCPVWGVKGWLGKIYPATADAKDFLYHYSRQFNSIELNTTHYRIPDHALIQKWREQTPDTFRFSPKWPQEISHRMPLIARRDLIKEFVAQIMGLGDRLGISFLQLPPSFGARATDIESLRQFLEIIPRELPIAVEVRHAALYDNHKLVTPLYDLLVEKRAYTVITDVAGRRDVLHSSLTGPRVLIRFIGNELHASDDTRSSEWIERLRSWINLGIEHIEFFVHQPEDLLAPDLINRIIPEINRACALQLEPWKPMTRGEQLGFF